VPESSNPNDADSRSNDTAWRNCAEEAERERDALRIL
jgi:hypothetical protein